MAKKLKLQWSNLNQFGIALFGYKQLPKNKNNSKLTKFIYRIFTWFVLDFGQDKCIKRILFLFFSRKILLIHLSWWNIHRREKYRRNKVRKKNHLIYSIGRSYIKMNIIKLIYDYDVIFWNLLYQCHFFEFHIQIMLSVILPGHERHHLLIINYFWRETLRKL